MRFRELDCKLFEREIFFTAPGNRHSIVQINSLQRMALRIPEASLLSHHPRKSALTALFLEKIVLNFVNLKKIGTPQQISLATNASLLCNAIITLSKKTGWEDGYLAKSIGTSSTPAKMKVSTNSQYVSIQRTLFKSTWVPTDLASPLL